MCKKLVYLLSLLLVLALVLTNTAEALDPDLEGWWRLDGDATDSSGNGNHGTENGGPGYVGGIFGQAIDLDGTDDYVSTGKSAADLGIDGSNPKTVTVWVYTRAFDNGGIWDVGTRSNSQDFCLRTTTTDNQWRIQFWGAQGVDDLDFTYPSLNEWVHFGLTYDSTNSPTCSVYGNGQYITGFDPVLNTSPANPFQIGCYGWQNDYFNGLIDDLQLYSRALTEGEIQAIMVGDPNIAYGPYPASGSIVDAGPIDCTWLAGQYAVTHNVYFGTNPVALTYRVTKPLGEPNYAPPGGVESGATYYWRIDEINDANTWIGPVWSFSTYQDPGMGRITREVWTGIGGGAVTDLTNNINYPDNPSSTNLIPTFEGPLNWAGNYGTRIHGWLQPQTSGDYTFWISTDDNSELWLSTDWNPNNAELIANEPGWSGYRIWQTGSEQSAPKPLVGGVRYYIMGLQKEGGGGDNFSVAWQGPDQPTAPVNGEGDAIIDGYYLYPYTEMLAHNPNPSGEALVDPCEFDLCSWTAGAGAAEHDVYFGTDPNTLTGPHTRSEPNFVPPGGLQFGTTYYWQVDEVDVGNPDSPWVGSLWSFTTLREPREPGMGNISLDLWFNMGGTSLDTLKNDPNYPHDPHDSSLLPTFEGPTTGYDTYDNYGGRMHGWLMPELSGDYIFYVCSDDPGELWLSSDMAPHNAELIAYELGVTPWRRQWQFGGTEDSNNVVGPIYLEGGNKYYIRGLWKEGGGGDYLAVAWQGPDQPDAPVPGEGDAIIVGYYLWPFVQLWAHRPDPTDEQLIEGYLATYYPPPLYEKHTTIYTPLTFDPGVDAVSHEAFFSEDEAKVTARDPCVSLGAPPNPSYPTWFYVGLPEGVMGPVGPYNDSLVRGTTYYWCVDEFDGTDTWQSPVWSFTLRIGEASNPDPYDFEDLISVTPLLTWERGAQTTGMLGPHEHEIYFGTNRDAVNDANCIDSPIPPEYMGSQTASSPGLPGDETWEPNSDGGLPPLDRDTDYYWRIDEVHSRSLPLYTVVFKGDVWTFKTRHEIPIADVNEVGWWRFDRGYGPTAIDSSGYDHYGSLIGDPNGPTWVEQGKLNGALYFDGDDDYVNIDGYKGILGANPFTIAAWIRTWTNGSIVTWGTNTGGQRVGFRVDGVIRMEHGNGNVRGTSGPDLRDGEWHHVAVTVQTNCAIEDANLYVDGIDVTEVKTDIDQFNIVAGTDVSIGRSAPRGDRYFNGIIDNVRIYDRELSAEEIPGTMRSDPGIAYDPDPENWADVHVGDVNLLTWSPGDGAGTHNVYFGTNPAALAGPYPRPLAEPNFDPGALQLGTTYYWRIDEVNGIDTWTGDIWRFNVMSGSRGLVGDYYHFTSPGAPPSRADTFAGSRVLTRIDPRIDFFWDGGSPDLSVNVDFFSVRWSGAIQPDEDGLYTFLTYTDDGLRLWVDDVLIIENWTNHGSTWDTNEIELTAGETYTILMEFYEWGGGARAELWWQTPSMPMRQFVPERVLAQPLWAYNPYPADGARLVDPIEVAACTWTSGAEAAWHEVYWGTDPDALTYRVTKSRGDETFLPTEGIGFAETYYWRVDEVNGTNEWTGDIWTFKTVRAAGLGSITAEGWLNITGTDLEILKSHPAYLTDLPDVNYEIITFDTGTELYDNYGGRVHGWLVPETSGFYNFWLTTDDQGELYLSENYPPGPDDLIAYVEDPPPAIGIGFAGPYVWDKYPTQDSNNVVGLIWLNADQPYYICALWKEGGGGDHCMVAWYGPDSPDVNILPVNGSADAVIDGWYLMPFERFWASNPNPYHMQELSADDITLLSWTPGIDANTHDVYFGISPSDVETGATPVISGLALDVNYYDPVFEGDITEWEWETTYYWRIDEVNLAEGEEWTGRIWTFKTTNYAVLEDFEPYLSTDTGTDPNALRYVWKDGYSFWQPPPVKSKSGSNIMISGPDDPPKPYLHYDNDYHDGAQGLALYYDNDGNTIRLGHPDGEIYPVHKYSEIEATTGSLGVDPNWTRQDIKALSLWFKGNPTGLKGSFEFTGIDAPYSPYGLFDATLIAAGTDIWDIGPNPYHDEFRYAYKKFEPSEPNGGMVYYIYGSIEARVDDVNNTNGWAKAGVMMRESLHVDSNHVMVVVTPGQGVSLQYRDVKRGASSHVTQGGITAPHWVKLSRDIAGFYYAEHANDAEHAVGTWHYINDDSAASTVGTVDMGDAVYAGLCLTSHNAAQLCKAEFSNIKFTTYELEGSWFTGFWNSRDIGIISNDPEPLYLALEDTSANVGVKYYTDANGYFDPNAALRTTWTPWNIDLNDPNFDVVDKSNVNKLYIGLGNRDTPTLGGSGVVYFDDIRLYRSRFIPGYLPLMLPGNIWRDADGDPDGVVDWKDLKVMADDWLITDSFVELLVHWDFNDGIGLIAADSSGNGHDGAITGAGWYNLDPDPNRAMCLEFLGAAADVNDDDADLYLNGLDSMTVSIWVKSDVIGTDAGFIIFEDPTGSDSRGIRYDAAGANGGEPNVIKIGTTSTGGEQQLESSAEVQTTEWQHLAVTWSSGNQLALYINGVLDTPSANSAATTGTTTGATKLLVGKGGKFDGTAVTGWNGLIDEVRIYDHALPAVEIANLALNAEPSSLYLPVPSPANIYDHPVIEPEGLRSVNFRDFARMANYWLEEELKWPL